MVPLQQIPITTPQSQGAILTAENWRRRRIICQLVLYGNVQNWFRVQWTMSRKVKDAFIVVLEEEREYQRIGYSPMNSMWVVWL